MNDHLPPSGEEHELERAQQLIANAVRTDGDRAQLVREVSAIFAGLAWPEYADRRVLVFRELAWAVYPGSLSQLRQLADDVLPPSSKLREPSLEAAYLNVKGNILRACGAFAEATHAFLKCQRCAGSCGDSETEAAGLMNLGMLEASAGLHLTAVATYKRAREIAVAGHKAYSTTLTTYNLASTFSFLGRRADMMREANLGLAHVPAFLSTDEIGRYGYVVQALHGLLAVAMAEQDDAEGALAHLARTREWARHNGQRLEPHYHFVEAATDALLQTLPDAMQRLRVTVECMSAEMKELFSDELLYVLYAASKAQGDSAGAADALEALSRVYRERSTAVIGALADLPRSEGHGRPQAGEYEEFVSGLKASILAHTSPLTDPWQHLLELAVSATAEEDPTRLHPFRTARLALLLATAAGLPAESRRLVRDAALLHDIGKVAVPPPVLKSGGVDDRERALYNSHAGIGADMIARSRIDNAAAIAQIVREHHSPHERARGEALPLAGQIVALADAVDSYLKGRPWRPAMPVRSAIRRIFCQREIMFEPRLVDVFVELARRLNSECDDLVRFLEQDTEEVESGGFRRVVG